MARSDAPGEGVVECVVRADLPDGGNVAAGDIHTQEQVDRVLLLSVCIRK